jgi:Flp pilus assembly protein TadG
MLITVTFLFSASLAMIAKVQLSNVVGTAAQTVLANATVAPGGDPCALIATNVSSSLPSFNASKLTYTVTIPNSSGQSVQYGPTAGSGFSCTGAVAILMADQNSTTNTVPGTLTVSYPYSWLPMYMLSFSGTLTASQTIPIEL